MNSLGKKVEGQRKTLLDLIAETRERADDIRNRLDEATRHIENALNSLDEAEAEL